MPSPPSWRVPRAIPDRDRLVGLLRVYEAELLARGELIRGLMTRARSEPLLAEVLAGEIIGRVGSVLFPWFQERMTAGVFRPVHPALALQLLITPIALRVIGEPMFLALRSVGVPTAADDLESWVDLILAGLGADATHVSRPGRLTEPRYRIPIPLGRAVPARFALFERPVDAVCRHGGQVRVGREGLRPEHAGTAPGA